MDLSNLFSIINELKPIVLMLGRIKVNNTVQVFEEAFIRLKWYTEGTPLVKLNRAWRATRAHSLASSGRAGPRPWAWRVETR
jgi:hypothetical protein